jgi:hypothetical protein
MVILILLGFYPCGFKIDNAFMFYPLAPPKPVTVSKRMTFIIGVRKDPMTRYQLIIVHYPVMAISQWKIVRKPHIKERQRQPRSPHRQTLKR